MDGCMDGWMDGWRWMNERMNEWERIMSERLNEEEKGGPTQWQWIVVVEAVRRDLLQCIWSQYNCGGRYCKANSAWTMFLLTSKALLGIPRLFDALLFPLQRYPVYKAFSVAVLCSKKRPCVTSQFSFLCRTVFALHWKNTILHFKALPNSTRYNCLLKRAVPFLSSKVLRPSSSDLQTIQSNYVKLVRFFNFHIVLNSRWNQIDRKIFGHYSDAGCLWN